jgi:hypothetical protein
MKPLIVLALSFLAVGTARPLRAQAGPPRFELYGGYDYVRFNINANVAGFPPTESVNLNGGSSQLEYNLNDWFGIVGDLGGYYGSAAGARGGAFSYLFGPRLNLRRQRITPFAQVLFGGFLSSSGIGTPGPDNQYGMSAGGGVDLKISRRLSFRPLQVEYFMTKVPDGLNNRQNNFRYSTGISFLFGRT